MFRFNESFSKSNLNDPVFFPLCELISCHMPRFVDQYRKSKPKPKYYDPKKFHKYFNKHLVCYLIYLSQTMP